MVSATPLSPRARACLLAPGACALVYCALQTPALDPGPAAAVWQALLELSLLLVAASVLAASGRIPRTALALFVITAMGARLSFGVIDDGYISLRYARNFANGHGLVFNLGERVEGYTSFLWVLLLGSLRRVAQLDLVLWSPVLGVIAMGVAVFVTDRTACRFLTAEGPGCGLLIACHLPCVFWSFSGMETGLCLALMSGAVFGMSVFIESEHEALAAVAWSGVCWVLAMMTRPELYLLYAAQFAVAALGSKPRRTVLRAWLCLLAPGLLLFAPYFAWRYHYYGYLFPNTYYVKVGTPFRNLAFGASYLGAGLLPQLALLPCALLGALRGGVRAYYAAMVALICLTMLITGADHFEEWRSFSYLWPLLCLLAYPELLRALSLPASFLERWQWPVQGLAFSAVCCVVFASLFLYRGLGANCVRWPSADAAQVYGDLGRYAALHTKPDAVLAAPVIGALGYYSERTLIDMVGLTDATIAHRAVHASAGPKDHDRFDTDYVLRRKPDLIYLFSNARDEASYLRDPHWIPAIEDLKRYFPRPDYHFHLLVGPRGSYALYLRNAAEPASSAKAAQLVGVE